MDIMKPTFKPKTTPSATEAAQRPLPQDRRGLLQAPRRQHPGGLRRLGRLQGRLPLLRQPRGPARRHPGRTPPRRAGLPARRRPDPGHPGHHLAGLHRPPATAGLGYLDHPGAAACWCTRCSRRPPRGSLAGSSTSGPGPATRPTWASSAARRKKATAAKESRRWLDALAATEAALPAAREVITVADREADIYDLFARPRRPGSHLLIRVKPRRGVRHPERLLGPAVRSTPARGTMEVELGRADDRPPRRATLTVRYLALEVAPPVNRAGRGGPPYVALTAILVEEEHPPAGQEAVRWWLVTSLPIGSMADAERAVGYYALRWLVERYHFVMKSGCQVERLQLETAERIDRAVATYSAVAWRLLWLTYEARRHPEGPAEPGAVAGGVARCCAASPDGEGAPADAPRRGPADRPAGGIPGPQGGRRAGREDAVARPAAAERHGRRL